MCAEGAGGERDCAGVPEACAPAALDRGGRCILPAFQRLCSGDSGISAGSQHAEPPGFDLLQVHTTSAAVTDC